MAQRRRSRRQRRPRKQTWSLTSVLVTTGLVLLLIILVLALGGALARITGLWSGGLGAPGSTHEHADFKVYLLGEPVDFSQDKYQLRSEYIHVENGNGDMLHKHATGATLGLFFRSLGMTFTKECFTLDTGERYCNDGQNSLKMLVNGQVNTSFHKYEPRQGDRILISYGPETPDQLSEQFASVTHYATGGTPQ